MLLTFQNHFFLREGTEFFFFFSPRTFDRYNGLTPSSKSGTFPGFGVVKIGQLFTLQAAAPLFLLLPPSVATFSSAHRRTHTHTRTPTLSPCCCRGPILPWPRAAPSKWPTGTENPEFSHAVNLLRPNSASVCARKNGTFSPFLLAVQHTHAHGLDFLLVLLPLLLLLLR